MTRYMKDPTKGDEGWWLVRHPSYMKPFFIELVFKTWDHTRDGDRWVIQHGEEEIEQGQREWHNYLFIHKDRPHDQHSL